MRVDRIVKVMEAIAPRALAEDWDNVGLQVGAMDWMVHRVLVALDPTPAVIDEACRQGINLVLTHHPLLFKPLKKIDLSSPSGMILQKAITHQIAIFSAHTNLDSASGGLNDVLCELLGITPTMPLVAATAQRKYKLVVFVPEGYESQMLETLFHTRAGTIGEYTHCTFRAKGTGTFQPSRQADPFIGKADAVSHVDEYRLETIVDHSALMETIKQIKHASPYETVAYDLYPIESESNQTGIGRVGSLTEPLTLNELALKIKKQLGLKNVTVAGASNMNVKKVAVCSGAGSSLLPDFLSSGAEVYISGDFRYHDAQTIAAHGRGLIDIGHYESEHIIVDVLVERLKEALAAIDSEIQVVASTAEKNPFIFI